MRNYMTAFALVIASALALFYFYSNRFSRHQVPDQLCDYVTDTLHFNCVDVLQSDDAMHPGAVVAYRPPVDKDGRGRAEIPTSDLLRETCRVPGASPDSVTAGLDKPSQIGLPEFTYQLKNALEEGIDIPVPKLDGARISAGPQFSRIASLKISNDKAWIATWDEGAAADAFASCNIRQECVDRVRSSRYKVVSTAAVVSGLRYDFADRDDKTISLSGDGSAAALKVSAGGKVSASTDARATLDATAPYVVGVRFFPDTVFARKQACAEPVHFAADATTTVTVSGGGGSGQIGGPFVDTKPLGERIVISKHGTEQSECDTGLDLTVSEATINAIAMSPKPGTLQFSYDYRLSGGHYATVDGCPFGKWIGKHGHDNSANLSLSVNGRIHVVLRTDSSRVIRVVHDGPTVETVSVRGPSGEAVEEQKSKPVERKEGPAPPPPAPGSLFRLEGPGAYTVDYTARFDLAQGGAGNEAKSGKNTVEVSLE